MQLGSRSCDRLPCRRTSIRLAFPKVGLRHLVSAARYIRAARERAAPGFAGCSVAWPEGQRNSAVSLRSKRPKTLVASPAPPTCPKAILFRGRRGRLSSEDAPFRSSRRHIHPRVHPTLRLLHPESPRAFRISHPVRRFDPKIHLTIRCRSSGPGAIIRRVSAFPVTGGLRRLWPKPLPSLRSPRHLSQVAPFNGLDRRLAAATHDRPSEDRRSWSGHQMRRPTGSLARSYRLRRG